MEGLIREISKATGISFNKSLTSNSWYGVERRIRISDHFSKYSERMYNAFEDTTAIDLVNPSLDFAVKMINSEQWFYKLSEGVKIEHVRIDLVGNIEYVSHDSSKGYVQVKKENGSIVKYDFSKINIK